MAALRGSTSGKRGHIGMQRRVWAVLIWLVVGLLIFLVVRDIPIRQAWNVILTLRTGQVLFLIALNGLILFLTGLRWWLILRSFGVSIPIGALLGYRLAGFGLSYVTPGPQFGGEPLQVYLLQHRHAVASSTAVSSVYFDKLVELFANFIFLVVGAAAAALTGMTADGWGGWVWVVLVLAALLPGGHLAALRGGSRPLTALTRAVRTRFAGNRWEALERHVSQAENQIGQVVVARPGAMALILIFAGLVWLFSVVEFQAVLTFLGAQAGWGQTLVILTAARIAFLMPLPGGLGALEAGLVMAVTAAGMDPVLGLAVSLVMRMRDMVMVVLGMMFGGWAAR